MTIAGEPRFLGEIMEECGGPFPMTLPQTVEQLRAVVVINVLRERERCANLVETFDANGMPFERNSRASKVLAELIRKGSANAER